MAIDLWFLMSVVYAIVETLEKHGIKRSIAHLLAIPVGVLSSFAFLHCHSVKDCVIKGIFIGIAAVGACESTCNIADIAKNLRKPS